MTDILDDRAALTRRYARTKLRNRILAAAIGMVVALAWLATTPLLKDAVFWSGTHSVQEIVDHFMERYEIPGAVVAAGRAGEPPDTLTFGVADEQTGRPVQRSHRFQIAGISETITAEAILTLVDDGALELDQPLQGIFPEIAAASDPRYGRITIRHLLQHTSGLGWHPELVQRETETMASADECRPIVMGMLSQPLDNDPGEKAIHTDFGPCWLGLVIARISGRSYEDFVTERVLLPLGMKNTRIGADDSELFVRQHAKWHAPARLQFSQAAGWTTTAEDLFRFASRPIRSDEIASPVPGEYAGQSFGLGWWIWRTPSGIELAHTGGMNGTRALMARTLDDVVVVALFDGRERADGLTVFAKVQHALVAAARARLMERPKRQWRRDRG